MRVNREKVIETASEIADREGLAGVTLKAVAAALGLRTPSLYNHIESLENLLHAVAHGGMRQMNAQMLQAAAGLAGDDAVEAVGCAYFRFMIAHPGVYETIQWACWHRTDETEALLAEYHTLLRRLMPAGAQAVPPETAVRLLEGFLHGYTTQQLGQALRAPETARANFCEALRIVLRGVHLSEKPLP